MGSVAPDAHKDEPEENGLMLSQKRQQCSVVSNTGKWLQIVKNGPRGSFSSATCSFDNKIPRHLVSLDEKYLRRCLDLIHISAFKSASCSLSMSLAGSKMDSFPPYQFDLPVMIPKENVARLVFDLPFVDDLGCPVISPVITGCKRVTHSGTRGDDNGEKGLVLCDVVRTIDEKESQKAISLSSTNSRSSSSSSLSSEQSSYLWSPFSTVSQGAIQFTMKDNKTPHFVFSLDGQREIYVASLSTSSSLDYSYLIHLKKDRGSHLVGKLKVSTLFSVGQTVERQFVLFSSGGNHPQLQNHNDVKKNRGFPKKVVDALTRTARQRSISRFSSRTSSEPDFCSWEPFQEHELVSLLDEDLPPNLETLAVVVREQLPEEEEKTVGWGMKFLKRMPLARTSIDVVIPAGIHGGPRKRDGGPSSLIERWINGGRCDCSGWDLGCPLTIFKGQARKPEEEEGGQCNLFELFTEGSKEEFPGVRIMNVRDGLYFVQFQAEISALQSFSIALAYIHSQSRRLRPWCCQESVHKSLY